MPRAILVYPIQPGYAVNPAINELPEELSWLGSRRG